MSETRGLISTMSKKWKLEQIPTKRLEIENKLMEERLNQLKTELLHDKNKRSAQGGNLWSRGQAGPLTNYAKTVLKPEKPEEPITSKLTNRQFKLKILKDELINTRNEKANSGQSINSVRDRKPKCGQCEKALAFVKCQECGEDYCTKCFTDFHLKGALQKHRPIPLSGDNKYSSRPPSDSQSFRENNNQSSQSYRSEQNEIIMIDPRTESNTVNRKAPVVKFESNSNSGGYLMNGAYDEKEAQESFKQAVLEWRNGGKSNTNTKNENETSKNNNVSSQNRPGSSKDVTVGTDSTSLNTNRSKDALKVLEDRINSTHTLTYAQRILVQKYRNNEIDYEHQPSLTEFEDPNNIKTNRSLELKLDSADSEHIDFNSLMKILETDRTENRIENTSLSLSNPDITRLLNENNNRENLNMSVQSPIEIEEIKTDSVNPKLKQANILSKSLAPDIIESENLPTIFEKKERPSIKERPKSSRISSARPKSSMKLRESVVFESNLTKDPSNDLKSIANRKVELTRIVTEENTVSDFLLIDVESNKENSQNSRPNSARPNSARPQSAFKLSHKFYSMTPRNWHPDNSLTDNNNINNSFEIKPTKETTLEKKSDRIENIQSKSVQIKKPATPATSVETKNRPDSQMNKLKSSSVKIDPKLKPTKSSVNFENNSKPTQSKKPQNNRPYSSSVQFQRHKTFVSPAKSSDKTPSKRAASVAGSYASNRYNLELSNQFIYYDIDDGRSSRICQNEDDESYYGQLEQEFKKSVHRTANTNNEVNNKQSQQEPDLTALNESITKSLNNLEISLRNDGYDDADNDLDMMTMEELKSL